MAYAYVYAPVTGYSREWSGHAACNGGSGLIDISEWTYGVAGDEVRAFFSYPKEVQPCSMAAIWGWLTLFNPV